MLFSGIVFDKLTAWFGLVLFVLPIGTLWAAVLVGITLMTLRELWKGHPRRRRRKRHV